MKNLVTVDEACVHISAPERAYTRMTAPATMVAYLCLNAHTPAWFLRLLHAHLCELEGTQPFLSTSTSIRNGLMNRTVVCAWYICCPEVPWLLLSDFFLFDDEGSKNFGGAPDLLNSSANL